MRFPFSTAVLFRRSAMYPNALHAANPASRLLWLDAARVAAIIFMIQGHTLDVLLSPQYRQGVAFDAWSFLRGLTAPTFFALCGFSFSVSTMRSWESYQHYSNPLLRRFRRFLLLILLGYAMHLPSRSLSGFRLLDRAGWESWSQVDVLQCVGITLAFLQLLVLAAGKPKRLAAIVIGASVCVVLLTPISWGIDWSRHIPFAAGAYLTSATGSLFPLFPWSAYILLGAGMGTLYAMRSIQSAPAPTAGFGAMLILAGLALEGIPVRLYAHLEFWKASPNLFLIRVGCVCLLVTIVACLSQRIPLPQRTLHSLSRQSLTIYIVHICILYGSNWNPGLRQWIGPTLGLVPVLGWVVVLVLSMMLFGLASQWCKYAVSKFASLARASATASAIYHVPGHRQMQHGKRPPESVGLPSNDPAVMASGSD